MPRIVPVSDFWLPMPSPAKAGSGSLAVWAVTARNRLSAGLRNLWVDQFPVTPFFVRDVGMDRAAVDLDGMQSHHRIVSLWREKSVCNSLSVRSRTMPLDLSASNSPPATAA